MCFFFFKQKTAYEMRISDWSSDVCSSDLLAQAHRRAHQLAADVDFGVANLFAQRDRPALVLVAAIGLDAGVKQIADRLQHRIRKGHVQLAAADRKSVVKGKSVSVRVALGGRRIMKKNKKNKPHTRT